MNTRYVLAIDNGSQSTKVHVVDSAGNIVASAQQPLRPYAYPAPGRVVHPDDDLWDSITIACRKALSAFPGDLHSIVGVGLCTIRFCRTLLDTNGALVEPALSWMDARVSLPHEPDPRVAHVTTSSGYITHRLTGNFTDTSANYAGLWPLDPRTIRFAGSREPYEACGMEPPVLSALVDPGELLGHVTAGASAVTGIPEGLPVYATANDKAVEALGAGIDDDTVLLSLGTYIASMTVGDDYREGPAHWVNFACEPGRYLYESGGIRRGMWTVSWIRDLLFPRGFTPPSDMSLEDALNAEASTAPIGSGGVLTLLDWLAPTDAAFRRGALLGFDGTQGRSHVLRSVLEGIAVTMTDHIEAMEAALHKRHAAVVVTGGGAKSDLMMQMIADLLRRPAHRTGIDDSAGLGSAICAAVGAGVHPDFASAVQAMVRPGAVFTPSADGMAAYPAVQARYRAMRAAADPFFRAIADAQ